MKGKVVTFGEVMLRISSVDYLRIRQSFPGKADLTFAGAEINVAVDIALLGGKASYVTALPENDVAEACLGNARNAGVEVDNVLRTKNGRVGVFFVEKGANQRPSKVIYDRDNSSIAITPADAYDWDKIFDGATWFHISGITPALSRIAAEASVMAVMEAKKRGITVSCDLNYRNKLWKWNPAKSQKDLAKEVMRQMLPYVDVVIGNEEDADDMLGIKAGDSDVSKGKLAIESYPSVAEEIKKRYPQVKIVATTLRESVSASHNRWGAMLYDCEEKKAFFAPDLNGKYTPYDVTDIVDRIGGGDSFSGSLIFALMDEELGKSLQDCVSFAVASSCLCHSIYGDFNYVSKSEVMSLMNGDASGRVKR